MTNEQSFKNLRVLMNFVRLCEKDYVFFEFSSETKFTVQLMGPRFDPYNPTLMLEMQSLNLPYAHLFWDDKEHEILYYGDSQNTFWVNISKEEILEMGPVGLYREREDWERLINQTLRLWKLKDS